MEHINSILFIDIETVTITPDYSLLSEPMQEHWDKKAKTIKNNPDENPLPASIFNERAGVYSEFAKVVCIGFGSLYQQEEVWTMRLKALVNEDEKLLLKEFVNIIDKFSAHYKNFQFCGHNIKEFDMPFISRRMILNGLSLPPCLQVAGKKPWEVNHLDTMELWKFGDHKHYTTLALLAEILGIPSPKTDMDGSMVSKVYWEEHNLQRIGFYCLQDVLTSAKVFLKLKGIFDLEIQPVYT
jgi:hypothetical protein